MVRNIQAIFVQGRIQRSVAASSFPPISAAMAKAKATEKPTYPMYNIGGCIAMPGSCNKGFSEAPSSGTLASRANGLDVKITNNRNPVLIMPSTESTRASKTSGNERLKIATAPIHNAKIRHHNRIDPSCPPHTPEIR